VTFQVLPPTADQVRVFRDELWKERRLLEVIDRPAGDRLLRKHFDTRLQVNAELQTLELLRTHGTNCIPAVLGDGDHYVDLAYIEGIRIFSLLDMLRKLELHANTATVARQELVQRCVAACGDVQRILARHAYSRERKYYPVQRKLLTLLSLFNRCLALDVNMTKLVTELDEIARLLERLPHAVPFRDATPKNLILAWPEMWPGSATPQQQLETLGKAVADTIRTGTSPLTEASIVHIDFSSCSEFTVPEDDPVSLLLQEVSWFGALPRASQLLWLELAPEPARLAIGLAVRMYRLGGRRLAYRLVHANGYRARYADESLVFHFRCLLDASKSICLELQDRFPELLSATTAIVSRLDNGLHTPTDWFEATYGPRPGRYYRDVYPF
jgi:hypothetical protein